jgi:hypothetical protein
MSYRIAGVDVHKKMLAVAVSDVEFDADCLFERLRFGLEFRWCQCPALAADTG